MKKVAILILNWNGLTDTVDCINSIIKTGYQNCEIICLDNGSDGDEYQALVSEFGKSKQIKIFKSDVNLGFAGGCNFLVSLVNLEDYDFILLLNNDTIIHEDFFDEMLSANNSLKGISSLGILVPTIYYFDKTGKTNKVWRADDFGKVTKSIKRIKHPVGCAMLIRTSVIKQYGLFNDMFFAYGEEVEYVYRLAKKGVQVFYVPNAVIWHKVIETKDSPFKAYMTARNKWFVWKNMFFLDKLPYFIYMIFVYNPRKLLSYLSNVETLRAFVRGNRDGIAWIILGKKPSNPFMQHEI